MAQAAQQRLSQESETISLNIRIGVGASKFAKLTVDKASKIYQLKLTLYEKGICESNPLCMIVRAGKGLKQCDDENTLTQCGIGGCWKSILLLTKDQLGKAQRDGEVDSEDTKQEEVDSLSKSEEPWKTLYRSSCCCEKHQDGYWWHVSGGKQEMVWKSDIPNNGYIVEYKGRSTDTDAPSSHFRCDGCKNENPRKSWKRQCHNHEFIEMSETYYYGKIYKWN